METFETVICIWETLLIHNLSDAPANEGTEGEGWQALTSQDGGEEGMGFQRTERYNKAVKEVQGKLLLQITETTSPADNREEQSKE